MACEHTCCSTTGCEPGTYGQHFQQSMDQPGRVANPARSQLKRKTSILHLSSPFALEDLVSRERFSRPVPGQHTNFPHSD